MTPSADRPSRKRTILGIALLFAVVIVPFLWLGARFDVYTMAAMRDRDTAGFAIVAFLLLAADIILPIPSSVVATAAGSVLGPWLGSIVSAAGLSFGAVAMFVAMRTAGAPLVRGLVGDDDHDRLVALTAAHGPWIVALLRPVPVLSEASVIALGAVRAPWLASIVSILLSSTVTAAIYATLGAVAQRQSSEVLLIAAALLPPALAWVIARRLLRAKPSRHDPPTHADT